MPQAIPFIVAMAISIAVSVAFSLISTLLFGKKPKSPDFSGFKTEKKDRRVTARNDTAPREIVYGETLKSGLLVLFEASGTDNEFLHVGVVVASHRSDAIDRFRVNSEKVGTMDGDGNVTSGRFSGHARLVGRLGSLKQPASPNWLAEIPGFTADTRGRGLSYIEARLKWAREVFPNSFDDVSGVVRGSLLYDPREDAVSISEVFPGEPAIFETASPHGLVAGDYIWIKGHVGGSEPLAKSYEVNTAPSSTTFTLLDRSGMPLGLSTVGSGGTISKMRWSDNWALCVRDWLAHPDGFNHPDDKIDDVQTIAAANVSDEQVAITPQTQDFTANASTDILSFAVTTRFRTGDVAELQTGGTLPGGLAIETDYYVIRVSETEIKLATSLENARARIAINLTSAGSGAHNITRKSQLRYTCNGVVQLGEPPLDTLEALKTAGAGQVVNTGGVLRIYAGADIAQTGTFGDGDLRQGEIAGQSRLDREDIFNCARGVYVDPDQFYSRVDAPAVKFPTYIAEDGGETIFEDIELPFTDDPTAAQRLLRVAVEIARQGMTLELPGKPRKLNSAVWDIEAVTLPRFGFDGKLFQVVKARQNPDWSVDLTYREFSASSWDFEPGQEFIVDPAPNTNLPSPFDVRPPTNLLLESGDIALDVRQDGTVLPRILASWTAPADAFVKQGGRIEVEFKKSTEADKMFRPTPPVSGNQTFAYVTDVKDGTAYDVRVRSVNSLGVPSEWVVANAHIVLGKGQKPPRPDVFFVDQLADGTRRYTVQMVNPPPDVRVGGGWRIKYKVGGGAAEGDWATLPSLTNDNQIVRAFPYESNDLAAGLYSFLCRTVDSSGNESETSLFAEVTLGNPRIASALVDRSERALGWPGTLEDCFVAATGVVFAQTDSAIDDLPATIDELPASISAIGTNKSPIVYTTPEIDLGVDLNFRPLVSVQATGDVTVEMQIGSAADGAATGSFVAVAAVNGVRYIKIKVTVAGSDPIIQNINTILDSPTKVEVYENINTATETAAWFERTAAGHITVGSLGGLAVITQAQITAMQNVGPGYSSELISKSEAVNGLPAAEFKIYNGSGVLADATVDILLRGPKKE